jgi:neutral amino acid transport system ATP-binding protein
VSGPPAAEGAGGAGASGPSGAGVADPVLVAEGVRRSFGGMVAVDVDHLEVGRGTMTALIGPNGAGKTTLFNLLTGFDRADAGTWRFDGRELHRLSAHRVARAGMVRTFQLTKALERLSVLDNVLLGAQDVPGERLWGALAGRWRTREAEMTARATELIDEVGLLARRDDDAGTLSGGQRKLLELARALMAEPAMLMLDEPMAGVNPALAEFLVERIAGLRDRGITVLYVEHELDVVMALSDRVVCLAQGRIISSGTAAEVLHDPAVEEAYLGARTTRRRRARETPPAGREADRPPAGREADLPPGGIDAALPPGGSDAGPRPAGSDPEHPPAAPGAGGQA